eukprot:3695443-Amphidinium_carterae.1
MLALNGSKESKNTQAPSKPEALLWSQELKDSTAAMFLIRVFLCNAVEMQAQPFISQSDYQCSHQWSNCALFCATRGGCCENQVGKTVSIKKVG